jgi:hypothetical protein
MQYEWGRIGMLIGYWWESQGKRPLRKQRHKRADNITIDLGEIG